MLKSMLFGGTGGTGRSSSWVLQFINTSLVLDDICIDENGSLYVAGNVIAHSTSAGDVQNVFSARIENTGIISWQNYFGDIKIDERKQTKNGRIAIINSGIVVGGNEYTSKTLKGTQLCLYSVNGETLGTRKIYCNEVNLGGMIGIASSGTYAFVYGRYFAQMEHSNTGIYPYSTIKNYSPNRIVAMTALTGSPYNRYLCIQDANSDLLISRIAGTDTATSWTNLVRNEDDEKITGTGICVNNGIFLCGTAKDRNNTYAIVARYADDDPMSCYWIRKIHAYRENIYCKGISLDTDGNSYVIGDGDSLKFLIKLSLDGNVLLNIEIIGSENTKSVKTDTKGNVYLLMSRCVVKLTKDDIESVMKSPLSIGPLTFKKGSLSIGNGKAYIAKKSLTNLDTNTYGDTSSTCISREAKLISNFYEG